MATFFGNLFTVDSYTSSCNEVLYRFHNLVLAIHLDKYKHRIHHCCSSWRYFGTFLQHIRPYLCA